MAQTVCLDFDGVLAEYHGWRRGGGEPGEPIPLGWSLLWALKRQGFRVVVLSSRDPDQVRAWLAQHGLATAVDMVTREKLPAVAYVDDRAVRFDPATPLPDLMRMIRAKPHWASSADD